VRLLCDQTLAGLARWLRAAGCDTVLAEAGDRPAELFARCRAEGRALISRNQRLAAAAPLGVRIVLLTDDDPDAQSAALARTLGVDWTHAPFTRCLVDNAPLRAMTADEMARIPERARALPGPFRACPVCGRLFWPGSHVRRMTAKLERWARLSA
jgi:hypothetical protein